MTLEIFEVNNMLINTCYTRVKRHLRRQSSCDERVKKNRNLKECLQIATPVTEIDLSAQVQTPHPLKRSTSPVSCDEVDSTMIPFPTISSINETSPSPAVISCRGSHPTHVSCPTERPSYSFGLIADVQYADRDNVEKYNAGKWRYYRTSLDHVQHASKIWQHGDDRCATTQTTDCAAKVDFAVQLGDLIDGYNADAHESSTALTRVLDAFQEFTGNLHHVWGNHEMYNFSRKELQNSKLGETPGAVTKPSKRGHYYSFSPVPGFRFILLDTYEMSLLGYEASDQMYKCANDLLRKNNPNEDLNCNDHMTPEVQQYVMYNGGVTDEQLAWFQKTLQEAHEDGEQVIVAGHNPLYASSSDNSSLCWNSAALLRAMHQHPGCVRAYFSGHDHNGGFATDHHGVHHMTVPGVIETHPDSSAYGTVHVYPDRLELVTPDGGRLKSRILSFHEE